MILWIWSRLWAFIFLGLFLAACPLLAGACAADPTAQATRVAVAQKTYMPEASTPVPPTPRPTPTQIPDTPTPEPVSQRTNWILLGGDMRAHREGTGYGNKTDVILLVSVLESDPLDIAVVQFPRNLYVPTDSIEDQWLFAVYDREGWGGIHRYFWEVFGVSVQGGFYVDMDGFVQIVDDMGGACIGNCGGYPPVMGTGEEVLEYLRDNEATWGYGSYDAEQRVFQVLASLWDRGVAIIGDGDLNRIVDSALDGWGDLIQTDLADIRQWYFAARTAMLYGTQEKQVRWIQLEEPYIVRGDTPLEVRGMVPNEMQLHDWMQDCVFDQECEADP